MFKNRHFMMGLGIGLIIGALLLQLMNLGQSQTGQLWTKQKIEDAAKELDLKVVENGTELLTEEEWKQKMESLDESGGLDGEPESSSNQGESQTKPVEETKKPATPEEPQTPQDKKVSSVNNESPVTTPSTEQPAAPAAPAKPKKVIVEYKIISGSTLTGIAEGLEKSGVITDKEAFIKRAKDKKVNTKIRTGTYNFEIGEDFNSIITKLTAKPKY